MWTNQVMLEDFLYYRTLIGWNYLGISFSEDTEFVFVKHKTHEKWKIKFVQIKYRLKNRDNLIKVISQLIFSFWENMKKQPFLSRYFHSFVLSFGNNLFDFSRQTWKKIYYFVEWRRYNIIEDLFTVINFYFGYLTLGWKIEQQSQSWPNLLESKLGIFLSL